MQRLDLFVGSRIVRNPTIEITNPLPESGEQTIADICS